MFEKVISACIGTQLAINIMVYTFEYSKFYDQPPQAAIERCFEIPVALGSNFSNTQLDFVWFKGKMHWAVINA